MTNSKWLLLILSLLILRNSYSQNFWIPIPYPDTTEAFALNVEHTDYVYYSDWNEPNGIYRSDKEIISWDFTGTGYPWTFDMAFASDNSLYLASAHYILKSEDLGIASLKCFLS